MLHPIPPPLRAAALALAVLLGSAPLAAQEAEPLTPEQLVAIEKIRPRVEATLALLRDPSKSPLSSEERFENGVAELTGFGADVGPFMTAELDLADAATFNVAAYVLGLIDYPGSVPALRRAAEAADREGGAYGRARLEWLIYALALRGDLEAVDLAVSGASPVAAVEFLEGYRLLEIASVLTAPASVPRLTDVVRRLDADETLHPQLDVTIRALGATGDRAAIPALLPLLKHKRMQARAQAARSIGRIGDPAAFDAVLHALKDPDGTVQFEAATAIYKLRSAARVDDVLAALETTDDPDVRGCLYRALAATGGESVLEVLRASARRPSALDRTLAAEAVGALGSRKGLNLLRANLGDTSLDVVLQSIRSIGRLGGEGAADTLVALLGDRRRTVVQTAIEVITETGLVRGGPRIADRLLRDLLASRVRDPEVRTLVEKSCDALVALRYADPRADLRAAAAKQTDTNVVDMLLRTANQLDALAANGKDEAKWIRTLASSDEGLRSLAVSRMGELGTSSAVEALVLAYGKASGAHAQEILAALAGSRAVATATPLFEKILADPAWTARDRRLDRAWAAWGLRRDGGPRAAAALKTSLERRTGTDWPLLLYYAQIARVDALRLAKQARAPRLRTLEWYRGEEQSALEALIVDLEADRSIADRDLPPHRLDLH